MQHTPTNCISVVLQRDMDDVLLVVLWLIALALNLFVHRAPRKPNSLLLMQPRKSPSICVSFFTNWGTLKLSLHPSMKITIQPSRSSIIVDPLIALAMSKSDTLHFSIGDLWRISSWFTFLESWTPRICLPRRWVGSSTIVMPPISWGTTAILAGNVLVLLPASTSTKTTWNVLLNYFLWGFILLYFEIFGLALSFLLWCALFSHQGRVSAGQLCDLQSKLIHVSSQTAIYGWSTVVDDAMALRWSQEARSTRAHSFVYHTICSLIRLVFITSHLVYYSTMTSLDL